MVSVVCKECEADLTVLDVRVKVEEAAGGLTGVGVAGLVTGVVIAGVVVGAVVAVVVTGAVVVAGGVVVP